MAVQGPIFEKFWNNLRFVDNKESRYLTDFVEGAALGKGGFGEVSCLWEVLESLNRKQVVKVNNKLDGRVYAVKKVTLT